MNPFLELQSAVAARLAGNATLARIAIVTETHGDVAGAVAKALAGAAVKAGDTGKAGLAILVITPKGREAGELGSAPIPISTQLTTVRVSLFAQPSVNHSARGHQVAPLDALWLIQKQVLGWNRGAGQPRVKLLEWDSIESEDGQLVYYSDFEFFQAHSLE